MSQILNCIRCGCNRGLNYSLTFHLRVSGGALNKVHGVRNRQAYDQPSRNIRRGTAAQGMNPIPFGLNDDCDRLLNKFADTRRAPRETVSLLGTHFWWPIIAACSVRWQSAKSWANAPGCSTLSSLGHFLRIHVGDHGIPERFLGGLFAIPLHGETDRITLLH